MRPLRSTAVLLTGVLTAGLFGCSEDVPGTGQQQQEQPQQPAGGGIVFDPNDPCKYSLEEIIENLNQSYDIPTWEMLDCFRDGLTRTRPQFVKRLLTGTEVPEDRKDPSRPEHIIHFEHWNELWNEHPVNVSSHTFGSMGPFIDTRPDDPDDWKFIEFPLYPDHHDARLRYGIVGILHEKLQGRPVVLAQFVPPWDDKDGIPLFQTADEMKQWALDVWIPWRVEEAKVAERFLVDYYVAANELDALFQRQEILKQTLTPTEQVELVQWMIDETQEAVRPHYNGILLAYSYSRFAPVGWEWQNLSYVGYDEVAFPIIPECSVDQVEDYMNEQFLGFSKIVENSGNIPWRVSELDMVEQHFADLCGEDFEAIEADLYREALGILENPPMPSKPVGVSFGSGLVKTDEAWQVIHDYYNSH